MTVTSRSSTASSGPSPSASTSRVTSHYEGRYFHNLQSDEQEQILDYRLMIYRCSGADSEKLEWFKTINIAGEKLTEQELRNAVYAGSWVTDAKRYFSKTGCPAIAVGGDYIAGKPIRQDYLETAIKWINGGDVEGYMAVQQHKPNATELWLYFKKVIDWVEATFPKYRTEMKGIDWGALYAAQGHDELDSSELERQVAQLMADVDVTKKRGIYAYVLNGEEKHLNIRAFEAASVARHTSAKRASAPRARSTSTSGRCRPTTSRRGARVARPTHPTARCCAPSAIERSGTSDPVSMPTALGRGHRSHGARL